MRYRAITASGTAPAISSFTKRCCTACDQPAALAVRRVSVKRSGMTLVPVYPFDCQDSGSARAFHECARIAAAGTDCGLGGRVHADLAWAKLRTLVEGARLASGPLALVKQARLGY